MTPSSSPDTAAPSVAPSAAPPAAQRAVLRLDGEVTIYRAAELQVRLQAALQDARRGAEHDASCALEVDLSDVTEFDSAGLQLLIAAKKSAQAAHTALRLVGHSPAVMEVFELMDLAAHFGDPLLVPAARH